ncbi:hypothetical protein CTI12_AA401790 [Artemisia annua]|uniref:Uncharacterized protein n=1 Tax=Artemisia annua TaxID=35608 RepID=A0A2U1MAI1_ARTAN|nr:hypothetical protein CTI12_AA502730 [Artemisia annua]PWA58259.1 hypothetical protein CTI12_AA401790 [Artemisia annua]
MERALLITQHENQVGEGANFCTWLERCFGNYDKLNCELMMRLEDYWWNIRDEEASPNETWNNYELQDNEPRTSNVSLLRAKCGFGNRKPRWLEQAKLIFKEDNEWKDDLYNELDVNGMFYVDELRHELQFRQVLRKLIMKYC